MSILLFLIILVVLILVHEFGHFIVAKAAGIRVDEFGIGFPPRLFGRRVGETLYSLNALPLGGFVKIFGEDAEDKAVSGPDRERSFVSKPRLTQAAVLVAGVAGNILLAWLLLSIGFMVGMPTAIEDAQGQKLENIRLITTGVLPGSPAEQAGFKPGDAMLRLEVGNELVAPETAEDVSRFIAAHPKSEVRASVQRSGEEISFVVQPKEGILPGAPETPAIGVALGQIGDLRLLPGSALIKGAAETWRLLTATATGIYHFLTQILAGGGALSAVTGPVGIVSLVRDAAGLGFVYLLSFTALISINLAVINLLPFPSLDGGRLLFVIIEALKGSAIRPVVTQTANTIGFALLILLMLAVTYHDILKLVTS